MSASESVTSRLYATAHRVTGRITPAPLRSMARPGVVVLELAVDFITASAAVVAAFWCSTEMHATRSPVLYELIAISMAFGFVNILLLDRQGAYRSEGGPLRIRETERVLRAAFQSIWFLLALTLVFGGENWWLVPMLAFLFLPILMVPQKLIVHGMLQAGREQRADADRVVVYGAGSAARRIVSALLQSHRLRIVPAAIVEEAAGDSSGAVSEMTYRRAGSVPVISGPLSPGLLQGLRCALLIVATGNLSCDQIDRVQDIAMRASARVAWLSGVELDAELFAESVDLDGLSLASATVPPVRWPGSLGKRCVDLAGSAALLLLLAPLLILIAVLVRLDSPGPALFVQERVGRGGRTFKIYKFRSMFLDAPRYQRSPVNASDPRITRIGRLLRRTSLDELPQLLNVLRGEMSLVGPRPEMPFVVQGYTEEQRLRLQAVPGLTGLWQLSADRAFPIHEAPEYDLYYIRTRGFFMDLAIMIHTLLFAMGGGI